ncbi:MAG: TIGR04211 family SH3 domain-containing protein [Gammaproteobacteria bacterium]|jgi:SH3 domain protein|nr:TIGR04211 family SH3 domain-containing protein [Gammaproteobacteria bacterium]
MLTTGLTLAADNWVTDEFEVMMRTGKSNQKSIIRQLKTGTRVEVLDTDTEAGYTKVRVSSGAEGWVLSRYLRSTPTAKLRVSELEQRLSRSESQRAELRRELDGLKKEQQELQRERSDLQSTNRSVQSQLERVTELSADTIQVDDQNRQLKQRLIDTEQQIEELERSNEQLSSRADREWFLIGGVVLTVGLLLGLIIPRINLRKKSSWSDF